MPLELHVWGSGFGLPSIDAECLGAIAYLRHCLPEGEWTVIASSDVKRCPSAELPALKDGDKWVSRFDNIVAYLCDISHGDWDLNRSLTRQQMADCIAFTSFVESRGQPLLDLSLYVSSENFNSSTKTALNHILAWPGSWAIPGQLRDKAKKRSEHLGLSSLDVDAAQEEAELKHDVRLTAQIPERLRKPKQTVSRLLGRHAAKDRFRLDAITAEFMEQLEQLLGRKKHMLGDAMTSVDCLAIGYLALMQRPNVPHGWLKTALRKKHGRLGEWSEKTSKAMFQEPLPRVTPASVTGSGRLVMVVETMVEALPISSRRDGVIELPQIRLSTEKTVRPTRQKPIYQIRKRQRLFDQAVFSTLVFGSFIGYMVWTGLLVLPLRQAKTSRRNFGAAGTMLGLGLR